MTDKPHMTLPNGDIIREGDYARTQDGQKVGPMVFGHHGAYAKTHPWLNESDGMTFTCNGSWDAQSKPCNQDLVAKWHDVAPDTEPTAPGYNNGEWHDWTGGECPVHPLSVVEVKLRNGFKPRSRLAGGWNWRHDTAKDDISSFRVVTPYVETAPEHAKRDFRDFDLTNPYGTAYGLLDEVYGSGTADAMMAHGGPWQQYTQGAWREVDSAWIDQRAYRVKPETEIVTVEIEFDENGDMTTQNSVHLKNCRITFNTIDGKPDCASIRMEPPK